MTSVDEEVEVEVGGIGLSSMGSKGGGPALIKSSLAFLLFEGGSICVLSPDASLKPRLTPEEDDDDEDEEEEEVEVVRTILRCLLIF